MANLTLEEFHEAVGLLAQELGVPRLRDRLGAMSAFTSRRGLNSADAIAERLYRLSGGLRMRVPATYAFTAVWTEMLHGKLGEEGEKAIEAVADQVNACLAPDETIVPGKEGDLDAALGAYCEKIAAVAGPGIPLGTLSDATRHGSRATFAPPFPPGLSACGPRLSGGRSGATPLGHHREAPSLARAPRPSRWPDARAGITGGQPIPCTMRVRA